MVTGEPGSEDDGRPFILDVHGGPGFSCKMRADTFADEFDKRSKAKGQESSHCILFDYIGCGESDRAKNPELEYTVANFTETAAAVVEAIKIEFGLKKLDLIVHGYEFGGMISLNLPMARPQWQAPDSAIRILNICTLVAPLTFNNFLPVEFFREVYKNDSRLDEYLKAIEKVHKLEIKNLDDYIDNVVLKLGPAYIDNENAMKLAKQVLGNRKYTMPIMGFLHSTMSYLPFHFFQMQKKQLDQLVYGITKCSFDVLMHFVKNKFDHVDMREVINANKERYKNIPICCISGLRDCHAPAQEHAERLISILPDNVAVITLDGKQMLTWDHYELTFSLIHDALSGCLVEEYLKEHAEKKAITQYTFPAQYQKLSENVHNNFILPQAALTASV